MMMHWAWTWLGLDLLLYMAWTTTISEQLTSFVIHHRDELCHQQQQQQLVTYVTVILTDYVYVKPLSEVG